MFAAVAMRWLGELSEYRDIPAEYEGHSKMEIIAPSKITHTFTVLQLEYIAAASR